MTSSQSMLREFSGAAADMAHPAAYSFLMSLMLCVFVAFLVFCVVQPALPERDNHIFSFGFVAGGFVFSWLLGSFDTEYGTPAAAGFGLGLLGLGYLVFGRGRKNG